MSTLLKWMKVNKWFLGAIVVLLIVIISLLGRNGNGDEIYVVTSKSLSSDEITVSGKVVPLSEVELSFEVAGKVESINYKEGDVVFAGAILASLDSSDIRADLLKAEADLIAEQAKLNELVSNESLNISEVRNAEQDLVRDMKNAFAVSDDAIRNKTDQFFSDTNTSRPEILPYFSDYDLRKNIDAKRKEIERLLLDWSESVSVLNTETYTIEDIANTKDNLDSIRGFLELVSLAVNRFETNSSVSSSDISGYRTDTATARTNVNNAISSIIEAENSLRSVISQVPYQEAIVKSAEASVLNNRAKLSKMSIRAPFAGTVSGKEVEVGQIVSANQKAFTLITANKVEVEAFIPEIYISNIGINNSAQITLDAYGEDEIFNGIVSYIDPAATEKDGVISYKIKVQFINADDRIKSGMTARVDISAKVNNQSLIVPKKAVSERNGEFFLNVKKSDGSVVERLVSIGEEQNGDIEITSGISVGEVIILSK